MPEMALYLDSADEELLVGWLLQSGSQLVPEMDYPTSQYVVCSTMAEVMKLRAATRSFFVVRSDFSFQPLEMVRNEAKGRSWYFIMPRNGGPTLGLLLGGEFEDREQEYIRPGQVSFYRTYWDTAERRNKPAPESQVAYFQQCREWVGKTYKSMKRRRTYWIGPGARERLRRGARLVGFEEEDFAALTRAGFKNGS